jgi:hypothetical protein
MAGLSTLYASTASVDILIEAALFLLTLALICVIILFGSRLVKSRRLADDAEVNAKLSMALQKIILIDDTTHWTESAAPQHRLVELQDIVGKSKRAQQLLVDQLVSMRKNLSGEYARKVELTYTGLRLHKHSVRKLKRGSRVQQLQAVREMAALRYLPARSLLQEYLNARYSVLRDECRLAWMQLSREDSLAFLDTMQEPLTLWMQMQILDHFSKNTHRQRPLFSRWYRHPETTVAQFALRMTAHFLQYDSVRDVVALLPVAQGDLLRAAIHTLGVLEASDFSQELMALTPAAEADPQTARVLVRVMGKIAHTEDHYEFLQQFLTFPDHAVRLEAAMVLGRHGKLSSVSARQDDASSLVAHALEPLLQS